MIFLLPITNWLVRLSPVLLFGIMLACSGSAQDPPKDDPAKLQTRIFRVRPDFLAFHGAPSRQLKKDDPFSETKFNNVPAEKPAQEILLEAGITFPEGASTFFNPVTSQLIVRNTAKNIEKVIAFLKSAGNLPSEKKDVSDDNGLRFIVELIEIKQHAAASLLHQHMGSANADALREALQGMIKTGAAAIAQSSFLRTRLGKSKVESTGEHRHPTGWSKLSSRHDQQKTPYATHASPEEFSSEPTGLSIELNAVSDAESERTTLEWSVQSTELLKKLRFGTGVSEIEKPLFYRQKVVTQLPMLSGQWQILGTFSPAAPDDDTRTLVLVNTESGAKKSEDPSTGDAAEDLIQIGALMEYIEVDAKDATDLILKHSTVDGTQFLEAATNWINDGKAKRIETVFLASQQGDGYANASVQSVRELVYPGEVDPPRIIGSKITGVIPDKTNLVVPATIEKFQTQLVGSILDIRPTRKPIPGSVTIRPELKTLAGFDSYGREESEVKKPLVSNLGLAAQARSLQQLHGGGTELLSMQIPMRTKTHTHDTSKRVLVFLTTAVQRP
jgi:hypothetical protein